MEKQAILATGGAFAVNERWEESVTAVAGAALAVARGDMTGADLLIEGATNDDGESAKWRPSIRALPFPVPQEDLR